MQRIVVWPPSEGLSTLVYVVSCFESCRYVTVLPVHL